MANQSPYWQDGYDAGGNARRKQIPPARFTNQQRKEWLAGRDQARADKAAQKARAERIATFASVIVNIDKNRRAVVEDFRKKAQLGDQEFWKSVESDGFSLYPIAGPPAGWPGGPPIAGPPSGLPPTTLGQGQQAAPAGQPTTQGPPPTIPTAANFGSLPQGIPIASPAPPQPAGSPAAPAGIPAMQPFPLSGTMPPVAFQFPPNTQVPIAGPAPPLPGVGQAAGGTTTGASPGKGARGAGGTGGAAPTPTPSAAGVAGATNLPGQSANVLSGSGGGSSNADIIEAIGKMVEKLDELIEVTKAKTSSTDKGTPDKPRLNSPGAAQHNGGHRDVISGAASGAPGIEWANAAERWFTSRFGRRN